VGIDHLQIDHSASLGMLGIRERALIWEGQVEIKGVAGYLTKDSAPEQLVEAIRKVASGGIYVSQKFAGKMVSVLKNNSDRALHENLSPRELQVFCMIGSGKTLTEIAHEITLGVGTVGTYRSRILAKTTLKNNAEITNYAFKNKLIQ
jgi:two-component system invasion response regulator UvrY